MSKSPKEIYAVPDWMRQYLPLFQNTGGNDVEELLHDEDTNMFANSIRYMLIVSARSQFSLLMGMHSQGFALPAPVVPEECPAEIRELMASQTGNSPVIPDGWKLVPIEPTEKMVIEGFESEPDEFFSKSEVWEAYQKMSGCEQAAHRAKLCWAAMISAAPQQEVKL